HAPSVRETASTLLQSLYQDGQVTEQTYSDHGPEPPLLHTGLLRVDPDGALVRADGSTHPRRWALGWPVHGR
ncbi:adenylate cyclase, partial [Streptomyces sp. NPDC005534]